MSAPDIQTITQRELPLGVRWPDRRPLVPIQTCEAILDLMCNEMMCEIEDGRLAWAWHIESPGTARRCIRVWRECLVRRVAGYPQPDASDVEVLSSILPEHRIWFTVQELRRRLTISGGHIINLIEAKALSVEADSPWHRGVGGSPRVTRSSIAAFLQRRRIT